MRFFTKICTTAIALSSLLLMSQNSHADLLVNGGFESGMTGWTCSFSTGDASCGTDDWGVPQEGSSHFYGYDNGTFGTVSQSIDTDVGALYNIFFHFGSSQPSPQNNLSFTIGDLGESFTFDAFDEWSTFEASFTALSASSLLEFSFDTNPGTGTLWLDGIVIEAAAAVPVPATLALFGLGLIGLGWSRRKA